MSTNARYSFRFPLSILVFAGICSCAWKGEGLVENGPFGARLSTSTGQRWTLVYGQEHRALSHLDGQIVVLEGTRVFKNLTVKSFRIPVGVHGMSVWFGTLERRGVQLGLTDRNNGGYYILGRDAHQALQPSIGLDVLVEGYVDGPHRIKVMSYTVLD